MSTALCPPGELRASPRHPLPTFLLGTLALWAGTTVPSHAVPSYARQTGEECSACHIGAFGPQLTAHGWKFKLNGYAETDGKSGHIPLSAMVVGSWTDTKKDLAEDAGPYQGRNNNAVMQEASVFLAGGLTEHLGTFVQGTYSGIERKFALDNADVRYAQPLEIAGEEAIVGVTFNNNPSVTDPFNNLPAWRFPYMSSELTPGPIASPILDGGLEQQVGGISLYTLWNDSIYAELGGYRTFSRSFLENMNVIASDDPLDKISNVSPYWRLGYVKDMHSQSWQIGLFGLAPNMRPDGASGATDNYRDFGVDASYQFLGTREHIFTVNTAYIYESRDLDATYDAGGAQKKSGNVNRFDLSGSYYYDQTWGLTAGLFDIQGSSDNVLYGPEPDAGSRKGNPNTTGYVLQADWTPFGKEGSWGSPWANARIGLQYTGYTKFNGASHDYDGNGRDASDNNTVFAFLWTAF